MTTIIRSRAIMGPLLAVMLAAGCGHSDGPVTPTRSTKTIAIAGATGNGRVTSGDGKIDCRIASGVTSGPTCSAVVDSGSAVTLTASAEPDQEFVAWGGDCSGSAQCQLNVTRDATVSPRFATLQATMSVTLATPNADDGAVILTVAGPSIFGITPAAGVELAESRAIANGVTTATILVRGNLASGVVATLTVRGAHVDSPYTTQVREAATRQSGNYAQRSDLSQYRVTVQK